MTLEIRKAKYTDSDNIWNIIHEVISDGDTYAFDPDSSREKMLDFWMGPTVHTYVAMTENKMAGTFILKDNQPDLGSHVANAGYMVKPSYAGQGIGRIMCEYSLLEAKKLGYKALQFFFVVKSNKGAIHLWQKIGFNIIGTIPKGFLHKKLGYTDVLIMHKEIE